MSYINKVTPYHHQHFLDSGLLASEYKFSRSGTWRIYIIPGTKNRGYVTKSAINLKTGMCIYQSGNHKSISFNSKEEEIAHIRKVSLDRVREKCSK